MSITEQDTEHIGLIFCQHSFLRLVGATPGVDEDNFIAYLQFVGPFLNDAVIRLIVDEVDVLWCGTQCSIFGLNDKRLGSCFREGFNNVGGCFLQRLRVQTSYLVTFDDLGNVFIRAVRHLDVVSGGVAPRNIHHSQHDCVGLVAYRGLPHLKAQVFGFDILKFWLALGGVTLHVLQDGALFIQVGQRAFFAYVGKAYGIGLQFLLALLFEVGQPQVFKDHRRQFFHRDLCFIIVVARVFARVALFASAGPWVLCYHVADLTFPIALTSVLLATWIIAETVLIQRAYRNTHHLLSIR